MAKSLEKVLSELGDVEQPLKADMIYRLVNLSPDDLKQLQARWGGIPVERRRSLVARIAETTETDFEVDFNELTQVALTDLDAEVRQAAIEASWIDESPELATRLIAMASGDISEDVQATAISALGRFILLGELE